MFQHALTAIFCLAFLSQSLFAQPATRPARHPWPERQIVSGVVEDAGGHRVRGAIVFILDAETGMPYSSVTDHPFTDRQIAGEPPLVAHAPTGADGRFYIRGVFPGNYRVVVQSWDGVNSLGDLMELKSETTTLRGIAEGVRIVAGKDAEPVLLKPAGNAAVRVSFVREDTFILVSTKPLSGDPLLGLLSCQGDFFRNLAGATYMRKHQATFQGLPAGRLYFYAMFNDRHFAVGSASIEARAGETAQLEIPVLSPQDGPRALPERLVPLAEQLKRDRPAIERAVHDSGAVVTRGTNEFDMPLDNQVTLPDGHTATVRDIATVLAYDRFNRATKSPATAPPATSPSPP